jgi:cell filamentation protein
MKSWDDYFWPGTRVLANKLGARDPAELAAKEAARTSRREHEIRSGSVDVERTFDAPHLQALHRHLFGDVYDWAGQFREVPMSKGRVHFADVDQIAGYLADAARVVAATPWPELGREEFADHAAQVYAPINFAHPFREGNGRAAKVFLSQLAEQTAYDFDFAAIDPRLWNQQSAFSTPDVGERAPHHTELTPVFAQIMIDRPAPAAPAADVDAALRAARLAGRDHPTNPRRAGTPSPGNAPQSTSYRPAAHYRTDPGRDTGPGR